MPIAIPNANIEFDCHWAFGRLSEFNSNLFWVGADRLAWEMFREPQQPWASALVMGVDSLLNTRVPKADRDCISAAVTENWERIFGLAGEIGPGDLGQHPQETFNTVEPILRVLLEVPEATRAHYSFATKFLHWASRGLLPIVDGQARQAIRDQQQAWVAQGHALVAEAHILADPVPYPRDYRRWVFFYSHVLRALDDHECGDQLRHSDHDDQLALVGERYELAIEANTLVRILDKIFWIGG